MLNLSQVDELPRSGLWLTVEYFRIVPQHIGPLNYVADLPGRRPLRSAGTNRLAVPPVKLTTVANQPGFTGCRPTGMERSAGQHDYFEKV